MEKLLAADAISQARAFELMMVLFFTHVQAWINHRTSWLVSLSCCFVGELAVY